MSSQAHITIGGIEHTVQVIWWNLEHGGQARSAYLLSGHPRGFNMLWVGAIPGNTAADVARAMVAENPNLVALVAEVEAPLTGTEHPLARAMRVT